MGIGESLGRGFPEDPTQIILDEGVFEKEPPPKDLIENYHKTFVEELNKKYERALNKINLYDSNLEEDILIFVLMKTLNFDKNQALFYINKRIKDNFSNLLLRAGFEYKLAPAFFKKAQEKKKVINQAFEQKLGDLAYFVLIDFAKEMIEKIDSNKLSEIYQDKEKLKQYIYSLIPEQSVNFYADKMRISNNDIYDKYTEHFVLENGE